MTSHQETSTPESKKAPYKVVLEYLPWIAIPIIIVVILRMFVFGLYEIPSASMQNTLTIGDRVLALKPDLAKPQRGDVITFTDPGGWLDAQTEQRSSMLIKRLIGMPGDTVACEGPGSPITVNGEALDESAYLKEGVNPSDIAFSITVPENRVFVLGDNRANSADSRYHLETESGTVPISNITGVSKFVYWPVNHWRTT